MTKDSTPLNADDELDKYLFDTWNMKDTVHNRALANGIKKWHNKQVEEVLDRLESQSRRADDCTDDTYVIKMIRIEDERNRLNKLKEAK